MGLEHLVLPNVKWEYIQELSLLYISKSNLDQDSWFDFKRPNNMPEGISCQVDDTRSLCGTCWRLIPFDV